MAPRRWSCLHLVFVVIVSVSVSVSTWVLADDSRLSWRSKNTTAGWRQFDDLRDEVAREEETLLEQRQLMREDRMDASSLGQLVVSPSTQASIRPVLGAPSTSSSLSTSRPPTIAVCIPATYGMYLMCHEAIFGQLAQYETMPTEFVISVSQVNGDVEENRLNEIEWEMRVKYPRAFNTSMKIFGRSGARSQGDNRNHAAEHTHSDLIAFFDSDDYAHPSRLRILVDTFRAQPDLDIIIHSYTRWETITEEVFKVSVIAIMHLLHSRSLSYHSPTNQFSLSSLTHQPILSPITHPQSCTCCTLRSMCRTITDQ
eukprot:TRINITY_DN1208_c0_g3_i2.p1 TRINITY_DN1208_c0_g3~~TRINITY_DN1208_c0_g3_i2.p1  ORF type:complete len:313 (+),score=40.40 TRINITY_DN1208_c0_g3_i2:307-1245(+)